MLAARTVNILGPAYDLFIHSLKSNKTRAEYTRLLVEFAKWKQVDSLQMLITYSSDGANTKAVKNDVIQYLIHLKNNRHLSYSSCNNSLSAIKHFFEMNDVILPWRQIAKFLGQNERVNEDRGYTHEEIAKFLNVADLKYKAIIFLMASTGARVGAIPGLRIGDISKVSDFEIFKVSIYRNTSEEYYNFCTPECYKVINEYLEYRTRLGEKLNPESPLFREDFNPDDPIKVRNPKRLAYPTVKDKLRGLRVRVGVSEYHPITETNKRGKRRNKVQGNHGLRKFCITQMGRSRMDPEIREMLVGHKLGVRAVYLKYSEEDRLNEYLRAVDNLTINAENRLQKQVDEFKKQESEVQELRKEKDDQIQELRQQMMSMQEEQAESKEEFKELMQAVKRNVVKGELLHSGSKRGNTEVDLYATSDKDFKLFREKGGREHLLFSSEGSKRRADNRLEREMHAVKRNIVKGELVRTFESGLEIYATNKKDYWLVKKKEGGREHLVKTPSSESRYWGGSQEIEWRQIDELFKKQKIL